MLQSPPDNSPGPSQYDSAIDWPAVLEEHRRWLTTVVRCRVEDTHAVDDVMQEVALAVLRQNSRPADRAKVAPWLYRVAVRQAISHRRRRGRRQKLVDTASQRSCLEQPVADPRDWLLNEETRQAVVDALAQLPSQDRQILMLKYTENWCYRQLADHLGVGTGAVEYRLIRAKKRLRSQLRRLGCGSDMR
jgi:RNA polymerase sigma-70 factor (ECF subfamily)